MNAPTQLAHVTPEIKPRPAPPALIEALKSRFGAQFSEAMAVREQHGRDDGELERRPAMRPAAPRDEQPAPGLAFSGHG